MKINLPSRAAMTLKFNESRDALHTIGDEIPQTAKRLFQVGPQKQYVRVFKSPTTGEHFANIDGYAVPRDICGLAAGKDVWMRKILFKCVECRTRTTAESLECGLCETCYDKAGEENAIADGNA